MNSTPEPAAGPPPPRPTVPEAQVAESQVAESHGADVSAEAPGWLREAVQLAADHGQDQVREELDFLAASRGRPVFRVAVVGEFNRGKSTLINRLLGRDLLPTGSLPVTRVPVVVRAAPDEALRIGWPDGRRELRRFDGGEPWQGLTGTPLTEGSGDVGGSPEPSLTVTVADGWLTGLDIELVDTPGVNSGTEEQFEQVRRTAAGSDAVLFVVSAVSPMGVTERRLLQEEVLCRHVPFTAVVVTMLDLVDADDREETLRDLGERLSDLPNLPVLAAPAPGGGETELAALRSLVEGFAQGSGRALWRDRRLAAQVADHCEAMARIAAEAIAAGRLSESEAEARTERTMSLLESEERQWAQLRISLTARQLSLGERLREYLRKERDGLIERLRWELERAPDPGGWWERDLPFRLRHELALLARNCEQSVLLPALTADTDWLDQEVSRWLPEAGPSPAPTALKLSAQPEISGEVSSLSRTRLATRLGAQGGAVVGYLIAAARSAPMPMVYGAGFSLLGGLLAEASIRAATEQQRREVDAVLVRVVDESTTAFQRQTVGVLSEIYQEVFDQLHRSHRAWSDARRAALDSASGPDTDWQSLAPAAATLAARIRSALQG
ncbi:dynamin family protein [Streptomyces sp. NPDC005271]|uniref:dynamin family protein n=1 Tax=unclassified Streptomyces TaxID=2593676 RepID=UPI0033B456A4